MSINSGALLRYNFRVVMFNNWWLLVFPLAASQVAVFWNLITQKYSAALPVQTVEMVSPLVAAFLSAHILSAEYPSRIGAILASKPVHLGRVVLMRLAAVLALVWALGALSLVAYFFGYPGSMPISNVVQAALASVPSTLFLALFALTFATLFRHPLAGFGVAVLYWALDLPPGPPIQPYLSLRSLTSALAFQDDPGLGTLTGSWWIAKIVLLVAAFLLYNIHSRMVFKLGSGPTRRGRLRALALALSVILFYLVSGSVLKVAYGYRHRSQLFPDDAAWFRTQFAPFGPIPVQMLFGPAFRGYLGAIPNAWRVQEGDPERWGDTVQHRQDLHRIVDRMSGSIWAPSAAELLARTEAMGAPTVEAKVAYFHRLIDGYPNSPYVPFAWRGIARIYEDAGRTADAEKAYGTLLQKAPGSVYETEALRYLTEHAHADKDLPTAEKWAREWIRLAPIQERFTAYADLAEILRDERRPEEAHAAAAQVIAAARAFRTAAQEDKIAASGAELTKWTRDADLAEQRTRGL